MKRIRSHLIGIDQGENILFSDYENDGAMWSGDGPRQRRKTIVFSEPYRETPVVHASLSLWDVDKDTNVRADVQAQNISATGFELVFRTWGDTKVARVRLAWMAIGELRVADDWDID